MYLTIVKLNGYTKSNTDNFEMTREVVAFFLVIKTKWLLRKPFQQLLDVLSGYTCD